jgi:hypothetical protein
MSSTTNSPTPVLADGGQVMWPFPRRCPVDPDERIWIEERKVRPVIGAVGMVGQ